jgi:hypothetical protein
VLGDIDKDVLELTTIAGAQRPAPARPDQRHPRRREDRIRQAHAVPETVDLDELMRESLTLNRAFADRFKVRLATWATGSRCA